MPYQDFAEAQKTHLNKLGEYIDGSKPAPTFDAKIDFAKELQGVQNATTAEQKIHLANALYDQVAVSRSLKELYKKPSDYFKEFKDSLDVPVIDATIKEVANQHESVKSTIVKSKVLGSLKKAKRINTDI